MKTNFFAKIGLTLLLLIITNFTFLYSNAHISTQAHQNAISMVVHGTNDSFFSAGQDGFVIKWTSDGLGEHYQLTELEIRLIAVHPNGNDIAVYETDGYSVHRVSVWNWNTLSRKFVKTFTNSVTELSFTAKGTLLSVGTATVNGAVYLNPSSGRTVSKIKESTGIVNMIHSSPTEKTSLMYSPAGHISYYNMSTGTRKERFQTEQQLEQVMMFNNNLFLAGVKNNSIYVIDALSGKTNAVISARSPILFQDYNDTTLYYMDFDGRNHTLKAINATQNQQGIITVNNPTTIKTVSGPTLRNPVVSVAKKGDTLVLGTKGGDIYTTNISSSATTESLLPLTDNMYERILDILAIEEDFYCLSPDTLFRTSFDTGMVENITTNNGYTNINSYGNKIILWEQGTKRTVSLLDLETRTTSVLFTPTNMIQTIRPFGEKLIYIEGNTKVNMFDMQTKQITELYTGTGLQDAILYKDSQLFVAKSASSNPRSPLISVDTITKETVMLPVNGNVAFSLCYDNTNNNNVIYGIQVTSSSDSSTTAIFAYYPERKTVSTLKTISAEDTEAFMTMYNTTLYSNIGKNQVLSYETKTRKQQQLNRSASLPLKIARTKNRGAVLNRDGSISWYDASSGKYRADWYMTTDGMWFEF
ncbi:MAG: hypothetical protein J6B81_02920 [Spirochaetaceae bacterium]|nr:hypothetical protein [Spirochaetaceae bacterium]